LRQQGMFGTYRYALAILVVLAHTSTLAPKAATYAVFSFYMLSGYLMTYVLREVYGVSFDGVKRFLFNRYLRIYPLYWIVGIFTLIALLMFPPSGLFVDAAVKIPTDLIHWVANVGIFGLARGVTEFHMSGEMLVYVAWSLHVELCFYILMALVLVRRDWVVVLWFVCSLIYTCWMVYFDYSWQDRYFTLAAASLPFSTGSLIYLLAQKNITFGYYKIHLLFPLLFVAHALSSQWLYGYAALPMGVGFYISLSLSFFVIFSLLTVTNEGQRFIDRDSFFGNLSYPVFLSHVLVAMFLSDLLGLDKGWGLFLSSFLLSSLLSIFLHAYIENHIEHIRSVIRNRKHG